MRIDATGRHCVRGAVARIVIGACSRKLSEAATGMPTRRGSGRHAMNAEIDRPAVSSIQGVCTLHENGMDQVFSRTSTRTREEKTEKTECHESALIDTKGRRTREMVMETHRERVLVGGFLSFLAGKGRQVILRLTSPLRFQT